MNSHESVSLPPSQRHLAQPVSNKRRTRAALMAALMIGTVMLVSYPAIGGGVVDTILSVVNRIETRVNQIRSTVNGTASRVNDLPQTVQDRLGISLDGDIRERVQGTFSDMRAALDATSMQLEAFGDGSPGTGCFAFRADLINLSEGTGNLTDAMLRIVSISEPRTGRLHGDTRALTDLIAALPCPVLLPMSIAFSEGTPIGTIASTFLETIAAVDTVAELYERVPGRGDALACGTIVADQDRYRNAGITLASAALLFKAVSAIVDSDDMIGVSPISNTAPVGQEAEVGVWGWASITLQPPKWRLRLARTFDTAFELSLATANYAFNRVRHCVLKVRQDELYAQQQDILREICTVTRFRSDACRKLPPGVSR